MKIVLRLYVSIILTCFVAPNAHAKTDSSPWYMDANFSLGYSNPTVVQGVAAPTLAQVGIGYDFARKFDSFFLGLATDFHFVNQYSDVTTPAGNMRGLRWNLVSPLVGYKLNKFLFKGYFEFLGYYWLSNQNASGQYLAYTNPLGGKLEALYAINNDEILYIGLMVEIVSYGNLATMNSNYAFSASSNQPLNPTLGFSQFGLATAWEF